MSDLLENKKIGLTSQLSDISKIVKSIPNLNSLIKDIKADKIISRMRKEGLLIVVGDLTTLNLKGEKRFKRTTPRDRDKWKREISPIVEPKQITI